MGLLQTFISWVSSAPSLRNQAVLRRIISRKNYRAKVDTSLAVKLYWKTATGVFEGCVDNMSIGGLAFSGFGKSGLKTGDMIAATLKIGKKELPVELQIRHVVTEVIGARFVSPSAQLQVTLEEYFRAEFAGAKLKPVQNELVKDDLKSLGEVYWYTDGSKNDLLVILKLGSVIKFEATFLGMRIEWDKDKNLRTGTTVSLTETAADRSAYKPSELWSTNEESGEIAKLAIRFVRAVPELPSELKNQIENILTTKC